MQNLGAVEFCPLLGCKYDVFATLPVPIQSSAKKNGKVQNLGAVEFCPLSDCIFDVFAYSPLPTQSLAKKVQKSAKS